MNKPDFLRWFNRGFWKAFSHSTFPIEIPKTPAEKAALVESVYEDIASARYAPDIPEAELVMNRECPEFCVQGGLKFHCLLVDFTPRVS